VRGYSASRFAAAPVRGGCGVGRARDAARDGNGPGGWNGCGALRQDRRFAEALASTDDQRRVRRIERGASDGLRMR